MSPVGSYTWKLSHKGMEMFEKKKLEEVRKMREQEEIERKKKLDEINKTYQEFEKLVSEFQEKYGTRQKVYFSPLYELMNCLGY